MTQRILAYYFLQVSSTEDRDRLIKERMLHSWHPDGLSENTIEKDVLTGEDKSLYRQTMVKYAATNDEA